MWNVSLDMSGRGRGSSEGGREEEEEEMHEWTCYLLWNSSVAASIRSFSVAVWAMYSLTMDLI
jgi:hypothetical protein